VLEIFTVEGIRNMLVRIVVSLKEDAREDFERVKEVMLMICADLSADAKYVRSTFFAPTGKGLFDIEAPDRCAPRLGVLLAEAGLECVDFQVISSSRRAEEVKTKSVDDYDAYVIAELDLEPTCPICGEDGLYRDQGVVDLCGTTLVRIYGCNKCDRQIVSVHPDLVEKIGG
jgi:predicted RNA-binding Zn-ribbon protein involved in translation (DUF1610 family)